jgi:hypothetical protein
MPRQIVLTDGRSNTLPTDDRTAVRVRAVNDTDRLPTPPGGEVWLALEVTPEPALRWQQMVGVRVTKAVDEEGQSLEQIAAAAAVPPAIPGPGAGGAAGAAGGGGGLPAAAPLIIARPGRGIVLDGTNRDTWGSLTPVRFKPGARTSTSLKEVSGTITARVRGVGRPLITVADVLKSAGKTVKGSESGSLKVVEITKAENGQLKVRFEMDAPADLGLTDGWFRLSSGAGRVVISKVDAAAADSPQHELALTDDKGQCLPPVAVEYRTGAGQVIDFTLTCQPQKGQGDPARLTLSVSKSATIEVPFTLKNVPVAQARPEK